MMTIRQIYDQYIYSRSTYCSAETIEKYSDDLRLFSGSWNTSIKFLWMLPVLMRWIRCRSIRII
jgi:hypothetical protein